MGKWIWRPIAAAALGLYFYRLTRGALHGALSPDDITNIYRVYSYPVSLLLRANLLFFETSPFYRPFASAWYLSIFHFAGINPLPYHVINLIILAANAFLTYAVARRLSGSRETGWLAALFACYHRQFNGLHFDTGFIFDVLCYFFYFSAFLYYLRIRQQKRYLSAAQVAACCVLYIFALNSKEMALTLPLFLGLYEWLWHPPPDWRPASLRRWVVQEGRGALATGVLTLLFVAGHLFGESLMQNPAYRPVFTWDRLMLTNSQFLGDLFFLINWFTPASVVAVWTGLALIAWLSKSRVLRFAWFFLMLSGVPIAFLEPRGAAQYYVVLFGWALYAAALLVGLSRLLLTPLHGTAAIWAGRLRAPVLLCAVMLLLYPFYKALGHDNVTSVVVDGAMLQSLAAQTVELHPSLPAGSRILLLRETRDPAWDTYLAAVRLSYRDTYLMIDRATQMGRTIEKKDMERYDSVLDYRDGRLEEVNRAPDPRVKPVIVTTGQGAEIYHADWSIVNVQNPGRRGEILIVKMAGLGSTDPDVPAGATFPGEPLAQVIRRIGVTLNGLRTETLNAFGWPGTVNTYRVDFRVPDAISPGAARLEIWLREAAAPAIQIPVR
jgi:hypothetical protein